MTKTLVAVRLRNLLGAYARTKDGRFSKGRLVLFAVLFLFVGICFGSLSGLLAFVIAPVAAEADLSWVFFGLWNLVAFGILFILSIFETKSEIFDCKDNDLLLSLPIPPGAIVKSRLSVVLVYNYLEAAVILLPAIVIWGIVGHDLVGLLGMILSYLLLPFLSTSLSAGVGYLVARLTKKFKRKSFLGLILYLGFFGLYFWGYTTFLDSADSFGAAFEEDPELLAGKVGFVKPFGEAIGLTKPLYTLVYVAVTLLVAYIAYALIRRNFFSIVTYAAGEKKVAYKGGVQKSATPTRAVFIKDIRRFFSSSAVMLNASAGIVFGIVAGVFLLIRGGGAALADALVEVGIPVNPYTFIAPAFVLILSVLTGMSCLSASLLSLEGKSFPILKSLPLSGKTVLLAKTMTHVVVIAVPTAVLSVLFFIASGASVLWLPAFFLFPLLVNIASGFFGTYINVLMPRFDFQNEMQAVKQSGAVTVVTLSTMFGGLVILGGAVALAVFTHPLIGLAAYAAFYLMFAALFVALTLTSGVRRYDALSA